MSNPWLKKNPYMSLWLSGAHAVAGSARGQVAAQGRRQSSAAVHQAARDIFSLWTEALTGAARPARKKRR